MKKSLFTLALLATVAACSAPAENAAEGDSVATEGSAVEAGLFADLGGEAENPIYTENVGDTLAVRGYDVVSYFVGDGTPVEGAEALTVRYNGYDYRFANEDNANAFVADPAKYAPAYGGYCAWAIGAKDALAPGDPEVYEIVDGKLYLNFNKDVQANWQKDIPGFITNGDKNYPTHSADEHFKS
ncbi:MAG: YHS domain-containing (seleno)protein [Erythrobacter sp.]|uniref:YHS domain-containing (seleno)protein n=1 Tax=Erythrobacter sp. TaxID=1042 RepID=UPI0032985847